MQDLKDIEQRIVALMKAIPYKNDPHIIRHHIYGLRLAHRYLDGVGFREFARLMELENRLILANMHDEAHAVSDRARVYEHELWHRVGTLYPDLVRD
jgi:hypothetical protein